jgi:hypothetical protein
MLVSGIFSRPGKKIILSFLLLLLCYYLPGQDKDSLRLYKKLKKLAERNKYSSMAYDAIFVNPSPKEYPINPASKQEKNVNPYLNYSGRIIRRIYVIVYDPFGYSVTDTVQREINKVQKLGNDIHMKTRHFIVMNKLLFREQQPVEALKLSESERILRESAFANDARILITEIRHKDSVDVTVIVHDKWPIVIPLIVTDISASAKFRNRNLFGLGQEFQQYAGYYRPTNTFDYSGYYNIANIDNTFISATAAYETTVDGTRASLVFDRPFYSPLARWAGGAQVSRGWMKYGYYDVVEEVGKTIPLENLYYDAWLGKNIKLSRDTSLFNQSTNLVTGVRYFQNRYQSRPSLSVDPGLQDYWAAVGNVGFSIQQFYKDKYIYRFGANEDVPEGLIVQFIYGAMKREMTKLRYYLGTEFGRAKHFKLGYLSSTIGYGVFFNRQVPNDITVNYKFSYFSDLLRNGRWFFRQFFNYSLVHGQNKFGNESVTVNSDELYGFSPGNLLYGKTKMLLNSETVAYMPYNIAGFHMAPVFLAGLAMLGDPQHPLIKSRLYQGYSLGLMFRNENLLTSTFQFSFGFYPFFPDGKNNVLKYNPIGSFTLKVRGFYAPKPDFVAYY